MNTDQKTTTEKSLLSWVISPTNLIILLILGFGLLYFGNNSGESVQNTEVSEIPGFITTVPNVEPTTPSTLTNIIDATGFSDVSIESASVSVDSVTVLFEDFRLIPEPGASELDMQQAAFITAFMQGDKQGMTNVGQWFLSNTQWEQAEILRRELIASLEISSRFPGQVTVDLENHRSQDNPGITPAAIPWLGNSIWGLHALGASAEAEWLETDAVNAFKVIAVAQAQADIQATADASIASAEESLQEPAVGENPASEVAPNSEPAPLALDGSGVSGTSENSLIKELPAEAYASSVETVVPPPELAPSPGIGFSPLGVMILVRDFYDLMAGRALSADVWTVTHIQLGTPNYANALNLDIKHVYFRLEAPGEKPFWTVLIWSGPSPLEVGDTLNLKSWIGKLRSLGGNN